MLSRVPLRATSKKPTYQPPTAFCVQGLTVLDESSPKPLTPVFLTAVSRESLCFEEFGHTWSTQRVPRAPRWGGGGRGKQAHPFLEELKAYGPPWPPRYTHLPSLLLLHLGSDSIHVPREDSKLGRIRMQRPRPLGGLPLDVPCGWQSCRIAVPSSSRPFRSYIRVEWTDDRCDEQYTRWLSRIYDRRAFSMSDMKIVSQV